MFSLLLLSGLSAGVEAGADDVAHEGAREDDPVTLYCTVLYFTIPLLYYTTLHYTIQYYGILHYYIISSRGDDPS